MLIAKGYAKTAINSRLDTLIRKSCCVIDYSSISSRGKSHDRGESYYNRTGPADSPNRLSPKQDEEAEDGRKRKGGLPSKK